MDTGLTLTVKEQKRLKVLVELDAGRLAGQEAAEVLGISLRLAPQRVRQERDILRKAIAIFSQER